VFDLPDYDVLLAQARVIAVETRPAEAAPPPSPPANLRWRNTAIIAGTAAAVAIYGTQKWWKQGFTGDFHSRSEGWFGRDTQFGGIDKLGHVYATYVGTRVLAPILESVGNTPRDSRRIAALTMWGTMCAVEVLDGFSRDYYFSPEDFAANTLGALMGWFFASNPEWDDVVDYRLAYRQTPLSDWDPAGDYSGQRYWLMVKADGIPGVRDVPLLRYLEIGVGYGAPGYDVPDEWIFHDFALKRREVFVGVSLNMSRVIADLFYDGRRGTTRTQRVVDGFFDVWQHQAMAYRGRNLDSHVPPPVCCTPP
jgi:hypothetical protein